LRDFIYHEGHEGNEVKNIRVRIFTLIVILMVQACSSNKKDSTDVYEELSIEPFLEIGECIKRTQELFDEWHDFGSSLHQSIFETRRVILEDKDSELSRLVKSAWKTQNENGYYERLEDIGKWPVSNGKFMTVSESFLFSKQNKLGECGAIALWNELMNVEFDKLSTDLNITTMKEFPKEIEWVYPDNMLWLKYWIFVNIKDENPN
jgi:hypothetical protein